jgi:hypothetical protein
MDNLVTDKLTDIEETKAILTLYEKAKEYLESFSWCKSILNCWFDKDFCIYDKIGVFLFEINPINEEVDDYIWIIVGDLPSVYLDKSVLTPNDALITYCDLMEDWTNCILNDSDISECYPVLAEPTKKYADLLNKRIEFIRREIILNKKQ